MPCLQSIRVDTPQSFLESQAQEKLVLTFTFALWCWPIYGKIIWLGLNAHWLLLLPRSNKVFLFHLEQWSCLFHSVFQSLLEQWLQNQPSIFIGTCPVIPVKQRIKLFLSEDCSSECANDKQLSVGTKCSIFPSMLLNDLPTLNRIISRPIKYHNYIVILGRLSLDIKVNSKRSSLSGLTQTFFANETAFASHLRVSKRYFHLQMQWRKSNLEQLIWYSWMKRFS